MPHLLLHIPALPPPRLDNLLNLILLNTPLTAIKLVKQAISYALQHPDFIRTIGGFESALDETAEGSDADTGADEEHRAIGDEFARERVRHETAEHGNAEVEGGGVDVGVFGGLDLFGDAFEEAGAEPGAGAAAPVGGFVYGDCYFD